MSHLGLPLVHEAKGPGHRSRRRHDRRKRRSGLAAVLVALLIFLAVVGGLFYGGRMLLHKIVPTSSSDYAGPGTGEALIKIEPGNSLRTIAETLRKADVIGSEDAFVDAANADPDSKKIAPGTYRLQHKMSSVQALALLLDPGTRVTGKATVIEGLPLKEALAALSKSTGISVAAFEEALKAPAAIGLPAYANGKLEGYLFPATYEVEPGATAAAVLKQTTTRFAQAAAAVGLEAKAKTLGMTPAQIVIIASLIEAEARLAVDYPKVARVIYNRLDKGMKLQFDSTVNYATGKTGITTTAADRASDSPYNTYKVNGLPAGPINSPGQAALAAALAPAPGAWLYFVGVNPDTGLTKYAVTPAEHDANVREFQAWLAAKK